MKQLLVLTADQAVQENMQVPDMEKETPNNEQRIFFCNHKHFETK